ncbi:MAG: hypothetical protein K2H13_09280 [Eubacterium sp.]|nr:hypothetical protein [Eubacterium sp.]
MLKNEAEWVTTLLCKEHSIVDLSILIKEESLWEQLIWISNRISRYIRQI